MSNLEQANASQLRNIEAKTGQDLAALRAAITASGKVKHGEARTWLMETYGLGYGDANALAHFAAGSKGSGEAPGQADADPLADIYTGKKAHLRAIHEALTAAIQPWGDFELAPKKAYVAFRRKKQFAMLGPKTAERAELGINLKEAITSERIVAQKPGGMCQYAVALSHPGDVDAEVLEVLRRAYDAAG
jgi:predicted transport protein